MRRVDDEIIADPPGVLKANRGNQLLIDVVLRVYEDARAASLGERERDALVQLLTEWVERPHDEDPESMDPSSRKGPVVTPLDSLSGDVVKVVGGGGASSIVDRQAVIDIVSWLITRFGAPPGIWHGNDGCVLCTRRRASCGTTSPPTARPSRRSFTGSGAHEVSVARTRTVHRTRKHHTTTSSGNN